MTAIAMALTALLLPSTLAASYGQPPALFRAEGEATASALAQGSPIEPGSLIEAASGTAFFVASFGAKVVAPPGSAFRFYLVRRQGAAGLRIAAAGASAPVYLEVAGIRLPLWAGDSASAFENGRVIVGESNEVWEEPGPLLAMLPLADADDAAMRDAVAATPIPERNSALMLAAALTAVAAAVYAWWRS